VAWLAAATAGQQRAQWVALPQEEAPVAAWEAEEPLAAARLLQEEAPVAAWEAEEPLAAACLRQGEVPVAAWEVEEPLAAARLPQRALRAAVAVVLGEAPTVESSLPAIARETVPKSPTWVRPCPRLQQTTSPVWPSIVAWPMA